MESIKQNAKPIAIAAGVVVGALGIYFLVKRSSKGTKKSKITEKEKDAMIKKIKVTYNGRILGIDTVADIFEVASKLIAADTVTRSLSIQKLRRENRSNLEKYIKVCEEAVQQNDTIGVQLQKEILARLGIPEVLFGQSLNYYLTQDHPRLTNSSNDELLLRAQELESKKVLSWEEFRTLFRRLTDLWETEIAGINNIKKFLRDPVYLGTIINSRVYDILYDEFGLQDEEISAAIATYSEQAYVQDPQTFGRFIQATQTVQMM